MCFARVRPVAIGLMAGGTLFTATAGFAASAAFAPAGLAATTMPGGGVGGTVTSSPVIWQCQLVQVPASSTPPPTTPPPTTPPPTTPPPTTPPPSSTGGSTSTTPTS